MVFLSENSKFSAICQKYNIKFIGATPEQIDQMGDKSNAKDTMKKAGVPTIPGSDGLLESVDEAKKVAKKVKYPVSLKLLPVAVAAECALSGLKKNWKRTEFRTSGSRCCFRK